MDWQWIAALVAGGVLAFMWNARHPRGSSASGARASREHNAAADANLSDAQIRELALAGRKIEAIKRYRQLHRVGLKEAKDAVEGML